jgi:hypothetical protein
MSTSALPRDETVRDSGLKSQRTRERLMLDDETLERKQRAKAQRFGAKIRERKTATNVPIVAVKDCK